MKSAQSENVPGVERATRLFDAAAVASAFDRMAAEIDARLDGAPCLALAILHGGMIPAGQLLPRLCSPVELDAVHLSRYRNTTRGGEIAWWSWPSTPVRGRTVLLIDDILDEGHSLAAVVGRCYRERADQVLSAVLVEKMHERKHPELRADFIGLQVDDHYVFGYGMDYLGWHRNAAGIFALEDE